MTHTQQKSPNLWLVITAAASILLITIGMRMTMGLFVRPVVDSTELSIQEFSLIIAVFQLMWGVSQPLSGALADRFGAFKVLGGGALLLVCACLMVPQMPNYWGLMLAIGLLFSFGTGAGGFSIIMGQVAAKVPPAKRGLASGLVKTAFKDRSYILLHLGFFTCGFHIAFLVTHLPNEIALCGLPASVASTSIAIIGLANIAGCIFSGWCTGRFLGKYVLFGLYASRVAMVLIYLAAPRTDVNFYIFAAALGFTWLATVAPTAAITGKLFGTRYLATLFGLTMLSHQIGGFLGSYIGGIVIYRFNDYGWMWYADAVLAGTAALLNLPIREKKMAYTATTRQRQVV